MIMSTATLGIDVVPGRQGWRSLYWMTPIAAVWIALTYAAPAINASGVPLVASRLVVHALIGLGLWLGLERADLTASQRRATWLAVMIPLTLWLAVVWSGAISGFFKAGGSVPLVPFAVFIPVIIAAPILLGSRRIGQVLDATPAGWIIALQLFRLQGSVFLIGWAYHTVPGIFALPAGIGDAVTGLFAVPVALSLASGSRDSRRAAIAWNVFGLMDFAIALPIGIAISLHAIETGFATAVGGAYPAVMIPAFGVPQAILLHLVSLRQLVRGNRAVATGIAAAARGYARAGD
jgi:hypothetical protein